MALIDDRGRLFGRLNLIDAATLIVLLGLLPVGYGAYLLFRPSAPLIESVTESPLSREELRIAGGSVIAVKLKVRGSGFNPLLRAFIGDTPALAFVFENPNSADVVVGELPAGTYDLVLYDGVQEVARARESVTLRRGRGQAVRVLGRFVGLDAADLKQLQPGFKSPDVRGAFEVTAIGAAQPAVTTVTMGTRRVDTLLPGVTQHQAALAIHCDASSSVCSIGGITLDADPPIAVRLAGGYTFVIDELLPTTAPSRARVEVAVDAAIARSVAVNDRDALLDERAAVVRGVNGGRLTLDLGADRARDGWSYRGQRLLQGAPFVFRTGDYELHGTIVAVTVTEGQP